MTAKTNRTGPRSQSQRNSTEHDVSSLEKGYVCENKSKSEASGIRLSQEAAKAKSSFTNE